MNKKNILSLIFSLLLPTFMYSHSLLLNVFDNEDNTITVEGTFSTGEAATGAQIRLEALSSGEILYKKRLPDESEVVINIPNEPYQIVLDGGPGHQMIEQGPEPINGFTKSVNENKSVSLSKEEDTINTWSIALTFTISLAFVLLFMTIFISIRNTNILINELKKS